MNEIEWMRLEKINLNLYLKLKEIVILCKISLDKKFEKKKA